MKKAPKISDIAQHITDKFGGQIQGWIDSGEQAPDWNSPWVNVGNGGVFPIKADGSQYRGSNVMWLWFVAGEMGFTSNQWFGYSGAKEAAVKYARSQGRKIEERDRKRGNGYYFWDVDNDCVFEGGVRKGESATPIVFYKKIEIDDKRNLNEAGDPTKKVIPMMRYLNVFNLDQIEGLPSVGVELPDVDFDACDNADAVIAAYPLAIHEGGNRAYYSPSKHEVHIPGRDQFKSAAEWYATVFHELGHSTGHRSLLDRDQRNAFGSKEYAFEELVAELTSAFVCAEVGIEGRIQHVEYLANWLKVLKEDKNAILRAASRAQAAADCVMGRDQIEYAKAA